MRMKNSKHQEKVLCIIFLIVVVTHFLLSELIFTPWLGTYLNLYTKLYNTYFLDQYVNSNLIGFCTSIFLEENIHLSTQELYKALKGCDESLD